MAKKKRLNKSDIYDILPKPTKGKSIYQQLINNNKNNVSNMRYRYELAQAQNKQNNINLSHSAIEQTINNTLATLRYQDGLGGVNLPTNKVVKQVPKSIQKTNPQTRPRSITI